MRLITRLNIGGPAIHAILLSQAMDDGQAFSTRLVVGSTAPQEGDMLDLAEEKNVRPTLVPELGREISPSDDVVSLVRIVRLLRQDRPDVVHTHMAKAGTLGRIAARLTGVPLVVHTYHGHVFHGYFSPAKTKVFLTVERALAKMTSRIVVVGEGQAEEIASYGLPRRKIVPIRLGLELERFLEAERYRGQFRAELSVQPDVPLVGIVARLVPIKAHEDFLRAAAVVRSSVPEAQFLVIGDGERRAELEALSARMGLTDCVRFLGWRRDLPRVYADLDVVALCSRNEGSPVALIEALASARPVVATAVGGVPEVVVHGETGLTVPAGDSNALAGAIVAQIVDKARAQRMGDAGRWHVYPRYSWKRLVDDVRGLYVDGLERKGRAIPDAARSVQSLAASGAIAE